ncbi:MAG TPA: hypothetical protein VLA12_02725 [Planctomycetaceae bacterium]|nr:hypothetical protein [Planctomycetaceae bacterium]
MIDFQYLQSGVYGLANAHQAGTMAGHLGAAVAAGYFFGEDQSDLPEKVFQGIKGELDRIMGGEEAIWFNAKNAGITPAELFNPLPEEESKPDAIASIATALQKNVGETRQSGHNIIFASIAIRALHDHPEYATPQVVSGIRKLIEGFQNAHAGRGYYGQERGWLTGKQVKLPDDDTFPAYRSIQEMIDITILELIATAAVRKQGFGGLWHIINHAAAITEIDRLGDRALAMQALPAHHQHIRLWRSLPDVEAELGAVNKSAHDPREPVYWEGMLKRDEARLTHRIKTLYGYDTLRRHIENDSTRAKADDAFLYLMD